jgi:hypothetical protein
MPVFECRERTHGSQKAADGIIILERKMPKAGPANLDRLPKIISVIRNA